MCNGGVLAAVIELSLGQGLGIASSFLEAIVFRPSFRLDLY